MKNAWKGLVVGALTGMAGGVAMDLASGTRRKAAVVLGDAIDRAPGAAQAAGRKAATVTGAVESELTDKVRRVSRQVAESDVVKQAAAVGHHVPDTARQVGAAISQGRT
jgi:hypothetical protein